MDVHHPSDSGCVVSLSFMACSGHHIFLRLLSLHLCNEYLSLPKKKKKKSAKGESGFFFFFFFFWVGETFITKMQ